MSPDLERDLAAFERNELSREQLLSLHAEAEPLIRLHDRMKVAAAAPAPDPAAGWAALMEKMDAPAPVVPLRRPSRARPTTMLAVAAALMLAGSAFAAVGPRVLGERQTITPPSPAPIVVPASPEPEVSPEAPEPTGGGTRSDEPTVSPTPDTPGGQGDNQDGDNQDPSSDPTSTQGGGGDGQDSSGGGDSQGGDSQDSDRTTSSGGDQGSQDTQSSPSADQGDQGSQDGQG